MSEIMTTEHPRWREFVGRLEGPEGCNFREGEDGKTIWRCGGRNDKTLSTAILKNMGIEFSDSAQVDYFDCHGGYCDCEILFNVDHGEVEEDTTPS